MAKKRRSDGAGSPPQVPTPSDATLQSGPPEQDLDSMLLSDPLRPTVFADLARVGSSLDGEMVLMQYFSSLPQNQGFHEAGRVILTRKHATAVHKVLGEVLERLNRSSDGDAPATKSASLKRSRAESA